MVDEATPLEDAVVAADERLDTAWHSGDGLDEAIAAAKRVGVTIGRDPVIQDAKIELALLFGCCPSQAFQHLVAMSQNTNRKVRDVARAVVGTGPTPRLPAGPLPNA